MQSGGRRSGLTFAPEAGSWRLRSVINKLITEEDLYGAVESAFSQGWHRAKLYFLTGLPTEADADTLGDACDACPNDPLNDVDNDGVCGNLDTIDPCSICADPRRKTPEICVVENVADLWAIERGAIFRGRYLNS